MAFQASRSPGTGPGPAPEPISGPGGSSKPRDAELAGDSGDILTVNEETPLLAAGGPSETASPYLCGLSRARFWLLFLQIMISYFVCCFDSTILASSHPVITSYFGSSNSASWLSTAFLLTSASFQPLVGSLSDAVGRRGPYLATTGVFLVATAWCAFAGSMTSLIVARAVCGLGAGGMMTLGTIIISDVVPIE